MMVHPFRLEPARRVAKGESLYPDPPKTDADKPHGLPAATRGLIVPVLSPARVNELAEDMKRHGFNLLFYPALFDGCGTVPGKIFPLHPALRGADGLKAALAAMKAAGVRVVPYISVLTWQTAGDTAHWLTKHPEWIDVDIAGRTRLAWLKDRFPAKGLEHSAAGNVVRTNDPAVAAKLRDFLSELATHLGAEAVAFADWNPSYAIGVDALVPPVGYAAPERLAEVLAGRDDPVDLQVDTLSRETIVPRAIGAVIRTDEVSRAPRVDGVVDLLHRAKSARPGWTTWLLDAMPLSRTSPIDGFDRNDPPSSYADKVVGYNPKSPGAPIQVNMRHANMESELYFLQRDSAPVRREAIVLDFRACPEKIADALRQVPLPVVARK
jgi:hypothetical protein